MKLNEGFEIDDNELDTLRDQSLAPKALSVFYGALLKLSLVNEIDTVRDVFEKADAELYRLYKRSPFFDADFHRVAGQLLRCFNQKVAELKGSQKLQPEDGQLSSLERQEYESMRDRELRSVARRFYCRGKEKLRAAKKPEKLLAERQLIAVELAHVYKNSPAQDDLGKWIFMLDNYVKRIVDGPNEDLMMN